MTDHETPDLDDELEDEQPELEAENGTEQSDVEEEFVSGALDLVGEFPRVDYTQTMLDGGIEYATEVVGHRAIPDVRDGLVPVQRRIIFAMDDRNLRNDRPFAKAAETVGWVIGQFHPHGDSAAYGAMVRLAQPWTMTEPLVEGQGNWGNSMGDAAAAARYTEARLSKIGTDCCADLHPEIVRYKPNFTEKRKEASVLPMVFPALIVNGSMGIAVGFANSIPAHNLGESIDACILLIDNAEASLAQVMKRLPAPDFPGGGIIVNPDALAEAYETGKGKVILQARYSIEQRAGNQQTIVITELPYGVRLTGENNLFEQITEQVTERQTITEITESPLDLSDKHGPRIEIKCKRGGNVQLLLSQLMKYTSLRTTVGINMTVLVDRYPRQIGLVEALRRFVDFRLDVVRKRFELEFRTKERELRKQLAFKSAVDAIDKVVQIVRSSKNDEHSKKQLIALLQVIPYGKSKPEKITEEQAQWIIEMQLRRLNQLNVTDLETKINELTTSLNELRALLDSEDGVREIVKNELRAVKKHYAHPRRTTLFGEVAIAATGSGTNELAVVAGPAEDITLYLGSSGMAVCSPLKAKLPNVTPLKLNGDRLAAVIDCRSDSELYVFTEQGTCLRANTRDIGVEPGAAKGRPLVSVSGVDAVVAAFPVGLGADFLFVTDQGELKRIEEKTISGAHGGGIPAFKLPEGHKIVAVIPHAEGDDVILSTASGQALRITVSLAGKIRPVQTGNAGGVAGMSLKGSDRIISAVKVEDEQLLIVHVAGSAKRVPLSEYPAKGRGTGGVVSAAIDKPTRGAAGEVASALTVPAKGGIVLFTDKGRLIAIDLAKVDEGKRPTVTRACLELGAGERVVGRAPTAPPAA